MGQSELGAWVNGWNGRWADTGEERRLSGSKDTCIKQRVSRNECTGCEEGAAWMKCSLKEAASHTGELTWLKL